LTASPYHRHASIVTSRRLPRCGAVPGEPRVVVVVVVLSVIVVDTEVSIVVVVLSVMVVDTEVSIVVIVLVVVAGVVPGGRSSHGWLTLRAARG
jgi:hypothetical protein